VTAKNQPQKKKNQKKTKKKKKKTGAPVSTRSSRTKESKTTGKARKKSFLTGKLEGENNKAIKAEDGEEGKNLNESEECTKCLSGSNGIRKKNASAGRSKKKIQKGFGKRQKEIRWDQWSWKKVKKDNG